MDKGSILFNLCYVYTHGYTLSGNTKPAEAGYSQNCVGLN
jgi:hypothetical protein